MRIIKLMADYYCFPLWEATSGDVGNIDPEELPISSELKMRLNNWASAYDKTLNMDYPPDSGFPTVKEEVEFKQEAEKIADQLRVELGQEYDIFLQL